MCKINVRIWIILLKNEIKTVIYLFHSSRYCCHKTFINVKNKFYSKASLRSYKYNGKNWTKLFSISYSRYTLKRFVRTQYTPLATLFSVSLLVTFRVQLFFSISFYFDKTCAVIAITLSFYFNIRNSSTHSSLVRHSTPMATINLSSDVFFSVVMRDSLCYILLNITWV